MEKRFSLILLSIVLVFSSAVCVNAEKGGKQSPNTIIKNIQAQNLHDIDLGNVTFSPVDIMRIKAALPDGGTIKFSTNWCKTTITESDTEINLNNSKQKITSEDIEALINISPLVTKITLSAHREMSNDSMIPLIEKYQDIEFVWLINFARAYTMPSDATAYSTFKPSTSGKRLSSTELAPMKYAKNLKAVDLGHHNITSLDFLEGLDLELVILGDNKITDISVLGTMEHLQYAELFMNPITDLSPLSNCKDLLDLNITGDNIEDLSPLDACTRLDRLWASRNVTMGSETQEHFVSTHPTCTANFTNVHATADNWRKHPRYKHYIPCLKSNVWVSFEEGFSENTSEQ